MATQTANVTVKPRSELGSRANKRLRDSGFIPGVIYGHKEAVVPVTLPKKEVVNHLHHGTHLFDLSLDGKNEKVLVKEVQYDHLGMEVLHVDFARVSLDERVEVTVPLELKGEPKGEADGGVLQHVDRDRGLVGIDHAAVARDELDPRCIDLAVVDRRVTVRAFLAEARLDFGVDELKCILAKKGDVTLERTVAIVGGEARAHLLVRQPLQLSSLATHQSVLRYISCALPPLLPDNG
jgi:ribosomal protein bL25 (Ctc-form)